MDEALDHPYLTAELPKIRSKLAFAYDFESDKHDLERSTLQNRMWDQSLHFRLSLELYALSVRSRTLPW